MKRRSRFLAVLLAAGLAAAAGCASSSKKSDPALGTRQLDCLVVQHEHDSGGSSGSGLRASPGYYIVFQTHEGQATSTYRLEVTRQQFIRFQDGDRVKLTLNNNILVNIQPIND
ncbi:MAG TPA: hypothetical protein VKG23_02825 [Thermoanaerobaculia bacterium]|nr:hypothetical protein [Thermoanaerobaculia bacterium]